MKLIKPYSIAILSILVAIISVFLHNLLSFRFGENSAGSVIFFFIGILAILSLVINIFIGLISGFKKKSKKENK